jgi:hypothetical protein
MDNFTKRMNENEAKDMASAKRNKALQDLYPMDEAAQVVSDNDYSEDEFDDISDNTAEPPRAIMQKPRPLSGVNRLQKKFEGDKDTHSPEQVAKSIDKYVVSLGADEDCQGLSALKAGLPNVRASNSGQSFKDTSRFGAGEETFGSHIPVPRFDATDKTFDPVNEVYGASVIPD